MAEPKMSEPQYVVELRAERDTLQQRVEVLENKLLNREEARDEYAADARTLKQRSTSSHVPSP